MGQWVKEHGPRERIGLHFPQLGMQEALWTCTLELGRKCMRFLQLHDKNMINDVIFKSQHIVVKPKVPVLKCKHAGNFVTATDTPVCQQEACELYCLRATQSNQSR